MIDREILRKYGLTPENLKTWFNNVDPITSPKTDPSRVSPFIQVGSNAVGSSNVTTNEGLSAEERRFNLMNRIRSRIQEGMDRNFANFKVFAALDTAWSSPFRQITPTMVQSFLDSNPSDEQVLKQVESWGLTHLIDEERDPKTGQATGKKALNIPVFFKVLVPLVQAYVKIRWAKIMNDRDLTPFFKYEPIKQTSALKAKCEVLTDRVQLMSNQYGYYDVMKQSVLQMLHYGSCLQFPNEEWHFETQFKKADAEDVALGKKSPEGNPIKEGDEIPVTVREGIRYHSPHPTRVFWDVANPLYTLNYGYGCEYAGFWKIDRFATIYDNPDYWNKDRITFGTADIFAQHSAFFQTQANACVLRIPFQAPTPAGDNGVAVSVGVGTSSQDRERELANRFYGHEKRDAGVLVTNYVERLIPKEHGLGDYPHPILMRFVVAGDSATILYAEPSVYSSPAIYYGYDADESKTINPSLSLEILPFQDQFTNTLSQIILTAKQNLANLVLVDTDQIPEETRGWIKNIGAKLFSALNIREFSGRKAQRAQQRVVDAIQSFSLPKGNTAELINVLKTILDVLERVLVMSSHEVAQSASHEQTREEVRNIAQSTSTRLRFTTKPVDLARDAMKRQVYEGLMAYGDDDFYGHIPADTVMTQAQLESMGFTFLDKDAPKRNGQAMDRFIRVRVKKSATAANLWEFSSTRDGDDRSSDSQIAVAMSTLMKDLLANPITAPAIGADQAIDVANEIAQLAGLPRDFKLRNMAPDADPAQQQAQAQAQLKQVIDQVLSVVQQQMQSELKPLLEATKKNTDDIALIREAIANAAAANGTPPPNDRFAANPIQTQ